MTAAGSEFDERFPGDSLDREVWFPYYLPHWSSRSESAATHVVRDGELHLSIPVDQPVWCADLHEEPLRVSCIQSGSFAGPLGSTVGQLPFRDGLQVREEQPTLRGYLPLYGHVEVRMRGIITARSMVAFWMSGYRGQSRTRRRDLCRRDLRRRSPGGHRRRRHRRQEDRRPCAGAGVRRRSASARRGGVSHLRRRLAPGALAFTVDGEVVRRLDQAPDYPMQLMIGVFDFPAKAATADGEVPVPELVVSHVRGYPLG